MQQMNGTIRFSRIVRRSEAVSQRSHLILADSQFKYPRNEVRPSRATGSRAMFVAVRCETAWNSLRCGSIMMSRAVHSNKCVPRDGKNFARESREFRFSKTSFPWRMIEESNEKPLLIPVMSFETRSVHRRRFDPLSSGNLHQPGTLDAFQIEFKVDRRVVRDERKRER